MAIAKNVAEREYLFVVATLPFLAIRFRRSESGQVGIASALIVGFVAGLMAFPKPQLILALVCAEISLAVSRKRLPSPFAPELLAFVFVGAAYAAHFRGRPGGRDGVSPSMASLRGGQVQGLRGGFVSLAGKGCRLPCAGARRLRDPAGECLCGMEPCARDRVVRPRRDRGLRPPGEGLGIPAAAGADGPRVRPWRPLLHGSRSPCRCPLPIRRRPSAEAHNDGVPAGGCRSARGNVRGAGHVPSRPRARGVQAPEQSRCHHRTSDATGRFGPRPLDRGWQRVPVLDGPGQGSRRLGTCGYFPFRCSSPTCQRAPTRRRASPPRRPKSSCSCMSWPKT